MKDHEWYGSSILNKLKEVWLYSRLEKWKFHQSKVKFLVYIISRETWFMHGSNHWK
jgi:hypothetical protein